MLYEKFAEFGPAKPDIMFRIYDTMIPHFFPNRDEVKTVLEIGVWQGQALKVYRDYFPNATVYGMDIMGSCRSFEAERIRIFIGDQANPDDLSKIVQQAHSFDLVIDDGGHQARQQVTSLFELLPHVRNGGLYVIEDIGTSFWPQYVGRHRPTISWLQELVSWMESKGAVEAAEGSRWEAEAKASCKPPKMSPSCDRYGPIIASIHFFPAMVFIARKEWK